MKRLIFAIAILPWLLIACNTVSFKEPQPKGGINLKELPGELTGHYYDYDHQSDLYITSKLIASSRFSKDTFNVKEIKVNERVKKDSLYNKTGMAYKINKINDSLFSNYLITDTLFNLADPALTLRNEGNDYFLNTKIDTSTWIVQRLAFRGNVINISSIETENEVKMMEAITGTKNDSSSEFVVNPTKEQFKKFIEQNGFIRGNTYLRVGVSPAHSL